MSEDSVADDELAAFVDRILRMKSEEDAIKSDIKEIYAEAKGRGYDKTRLGETVATVRKLEKDADGEAEKEAIRDLYLTAYFRSKNKPHTHAPARADFQAAKNAAMRSVMDDIANDADLPEHDAETGEIIEPQSAPQAAQAVTAHEPVATSPVESEAVEISTPIQPETAATPHSMEPAQEQVLSDARTDLIIPSSGHETGVRGAGGAANLYAEPGTVTMESCPPEGVVAHPFAACWPVNQIDATDGVREPIVKIGKFILDGRGRYFAARAAGQEYPTVQYDGTDPLADCIRWNMASRTMSGMPLRTVAHKLCKLEPERADEILDLMGLAEQSEAAQ